MASRGPAATVRYPDGPTLVYMTSIVVDYHSSDLHSGCVCVRGAEVCKTMTPSFIQLPEFVDGCLSLGNVLCLHRCPPMIAMWPAQ